jgi:hypothetical protein
MLKPISPEVERLMFLRDVVIPFVKEREKEGKVDLNDVTHPCGSPSCLLGWTATFPEFGIKSLLNPYPEAASVFGYAEDSHEEKVLFGSKSFGTLDDRANAIDRIIERKISEVVNRENPNAKSLRAENRSVTRCSTRLIPSSCVSSRCGPERKSAPGSSGRGWMRSS